MPGSSENSWTSVGRVVAVVTLVLALYTYWPSKLPAHNLTIDELLADVYDPPLLVESGKNLSQAQIIKVTEGVYLGFGYAFASVVLLEAPEGIIVVDTTESHDAAERILKDFRKINQKPIKAIVFTHHHVDHIFGVMAFLNESQDHEVDIWAYESYESLSVQLSLTFPRAFKGGTHQYGLMLGKKSLTGGIGIGMVFDKRVTVFPNKLIRGHRMDTNIAGLNVSFVHIPGEANDEVAVWLPETGVLLPSDIIYRAFPSLYGVRGIKPRNIVNWHRSLRKMRDLGAKYLVPSHTEPLVGADRIYEVLTVYMAGIQYVHDQTVRYLNKGLHPDDIVAKIKLPTDLANHEYLWQHYGNLAWNIKAVYEVYMGWFSGDPVELLPNTPTERSRLMVELVGSDRLLSEAEAALKDGSNLQWGLELASYVFRAEPHNIRARDVRWWLLREMAGRQTHPFARSFYLTTGVYDRGLINFDNISAVKEGFDMFKLLFLLPHKLKSEEVEGVNTTMILCISDTREAFKLQIEYSVLGADRLPSCPGSESPTPGQSTTGAGKRAAPKPASSDNGGLFTSKAPEVFDAKIISTLEVWKSITSKDLDASTALKTGAVKVTGSVDKFIQFLSYIE